MIDDPATVTALLRQMEGQLPIPALATTALVHTLRKSGVKIASTRRVQIEQVLYLGDEGGITCGITFPGKADNAVVVSLHTFACRITTRLLKQSVRTKVNGRENWSETVDPGTYLSRISILKPRFGVGKGSCD
jgi:hypothetical protein